MNPDYTANTIFVVLSMMIMLTALLTLFLLLRRTKTE